MPDNPCEQLPVLYEIRIAGQIDPKRVAWFEGIVLSSEESDDAGITTLLSVTVPDQSALFGILSQIRDSGLKLISINQG